MQYLAPYFSGYFYPELYLFTQWQEKYEIIIFLCLCVWAWAENISKSLI